MRRRLSVILAGIRMMTTMTMTGTIRIMMTTMIMMTKMKID